MTEVLLKGTILVTGIRRSTKAKFFKDLSEGDVIYLGYDLNGTCGNHAPDIQITFLDHNFIMSPLNFKNRMENFEYEQIS